MTRLATLIVLIAITTSAHAGDWPHWRGPNYDGSAEAKNLPTDFSKTKNVKWAATMPGPSEGTPIVFGDQVFVSSVDIKHQKLMAIALNRNTGKDTWRRVAGTGYQPQGHGTPISIHKNSTYAAPSPVTDGNVVVFFYGNGDLVACEMDGKFRWTRNLQKEYGDFTYQWTYSASAGSTDEMSSSNSSVYTILCASSRHSPCALQYCSTVPTRSSSRPVSCR